MIVQPSKKIYVLDTNVLIDFAIWHPIPLSSVFWDCLAVNLDRKNWVLLDEVMWEIEGKYQPVLAKWCRDAEAAGNVQKVSDINRNRGVEINKRYPIIDTKSNKSIVDTRLVAFAEEHGLIVFTREAHKENTTALNKIPDVCDALHIEWTREPEVFLNAMGYSN